MEGFAPELAVVTHGGGKELDEPLAHPAHLGDHHLLDVRQVDSELPRSADAHEPVVQRGPLGDAHPVVPAYRGVSLAGGTHGSRLRGGSRGVHAHHPRDLPPVRGGVDGDAGDHGPEDRQRAFRRGAPHLLYRSADAGQQGAAGGHLHNLGQNFAKAFEVTYQNDKGGLDYVWNTSWGVSTRLVGALVMTHGDDAGIITPPRLAQYQAVIVPIYKSDEERTTVLDAAQQVYRELKTGGIRVHLDARDGMKPGAKYYEWEGRGVPLRLEIGPRDVAAGHVMLAAANRWEEDALRHQRTGAFPQDRD